MENSIVHTFQKVRRYGPAVGFLARYPAGRKVLGHFAEKKIRAVIRETSRRLGILAESCAESLESQMKAPRRARRRESLICASAVTLGLAVLCLSRRRR